MTRSFWPVGEAAQADYEQLRSLTLAAVPTLGIASRRFETSCVNPSGMRSGSAGPVGCWQTGGQSPHVDPGAHPPDLLATPHADGALRKRQESRPARRLGRRKTARAGRPRAAVRLRQSTM
jgi:hypothetical protein